MPPELVSTLETLEEVVRGTCAAPVAARPEPRPLIFCVDSNSAVASRVAYVVRFSCAVFGGQVVVRQLQQQEPPVPRPLSTHRSFLDRGRLSLTVAVTGLLGNVILAVLTETNPRAHG